MLAADVFNLQKVEQNAMMKFFLQSQKHSTHPISLLLHLLVFNLHSQFGNFALLRVGVHRYIGIEQLIQLTLTGQLTIGDDCHQVEVNLTFAVFLDATFDERTCHLKPVVAGLAPVNRTLFESIKLIQPTVDWNVRDEVENVLLQMH